MADVTALSFDEIEPIFGGLVRRARAALGVSSFGLQVLELPPNWDGHPNHTHDSSAPEPDQEEVYIPLEGTATLIAGDQQFELAPGMMARVGPEQLRRILPGPRGVRLLAIGGRPGSFQAPPWTELGGPVPSHDPEA